MDMITTKELLLSLEVASSAGERCWGRGGHFGVFRGHGDLARALSSTHFR